MDDLLEVINQALRARGWSARHASLEAVGSDQLVRNLRRGRVPSVERFRALCEVLGLEFYVGPPRDVGTVDQNRLMDALETTEDALKDRKLELQSRDKAALIAAAYELIGQERSVANAEQVKRLVGAVTAGSRSPGRSDSS